MGLCDVPSHPSELGGADAVDTSSTGGSMLVEYERVSTG